MSFHNILIVDDSATSRMIIQRCCEIAGLHEARYHEAEDGLNALSFLKDKTVDLILTDLRMPKMDGCTFLKKLKLRQSTQEIPVIVVSSLGSGIMEHQLIEAGAQAIIRKPISPEKVLEAVGEI